MCNVPTVTRPPSRSSSTRSTRASAPTGLQRNSWVPGGKLREETRKFGLYTLTGVGTTAIFWGSETLFWLLGRTQGMRETGAVLGLTIGYVIKYNLDYRFVFGRTLKNDQKRSDGQHD